ncbi:hypothetical protein phiPsa267_101 [Pseudomonas phage phiPsa267]|uniref:Uncharacterized protein n=1 Tax=Pseudomonas phage phiPsa267 TaxID=1460361 RepID=A0A7G9V124_9CAUD|nr:hypothetical protein QGX19_gp129 [Pseudomonas phage phiPsa267]QNN99979.1 hypothetical protein phiPsa267_101 [Pseudomonas phage phiPsa267]
MTYDMHALFMLHPEAMEELQYQIARNGLEYADSFRMAFFDDDAQVEAYDDAVTCCGSFDTTMKINGKRVLIGCNYGH